MFFVAQKTNTTYTLIYIIYKQPQTVCELLGVALHKEKLKFRINKKKEEIFLKYFATFATTYSVHFCAIM